MPDELGEGKKLLPRAGRDRGAFAQPDGHQQDGGAGPTVYPAAGVPPRDFRRNQAGSMGGGRQAAGLSLIHIWIKMAYGSDCFAQIVLSLEDLARMAERGIYELQTWLSGMQYLPPPVVVPERCV